jgi:hypothetical protein
MFREELAKIRVHVIEAIQGKNNSLKPRVDLTPLQC